MSPTHHAEPGQSMPIAQRFAFTLLPLTALALTAWVLITQGTPVSSVSPWIPSLGIDLAWRIDGLSAMMLLMITGIGTGVFIYAGGYLDGDPQQKRLYILLSLFMLAMIGCVTADNFFLLFVCWEATSITSFLLVGFNHKTEASRKSAQQALIVTGSGGLALLAGIILISQEMGTSSISGIVAALPQAEMTSALQTAVFLIMAGAFTKSAQFPFHFWLPNAMAAPTPVSAYLHSATMVKLGVFLLARLDGGLDAWPVWQVTLQVFGSITAAWGMLLALRERDMKRILAWSTVATLGTLVALIGLPGGNAAVAVGALLLAHALYKAPLFFVAGNVDHGTGTRIIDNLGRLRHSMPFTATAAILAGVSMAGIPLSFGYAAKDLIGDAKTVDGVLAFTTYGNTIFSAIAVAVAGVAAIRVFWRHPGKNVTPADAHEGGLALVGPPLVLAALGMVLGVFPGLAEHLIEDVGLALAPLANADVNFEGPVLSIGPSLVTFLVSFAVGVGVYVFWDPLHKVMDRLTAATQGISALSFYERFLKGVPKLAASLTRAVQHGSAPGYMAFTVVISTAGIAAALFAGWGTFSLPDAGLPSWGVASAALLIAVGAASAAILRDRLVMLLGASLVGLGSAGIFLFGGAPDVAYTQFVVETVVVIVLAAVLLALRREGRPHAVSEPEPVNRNLVISAAFATVLTLTLLITVGGPFDNSLAQWMAEQSVPAAQGRNVVNVILVDFRALDTLGEISVVMFSFLAALPLLMAVRASRKAQQGGNNE